MYKGALVLSLLLRLFVVSAQTSAKYVDGVKVIIPISTFLSKGDHHIWTENAFLNHNDVLLRMYNLGHDSIMFSVVNDSKDTISIPYSSDLPKCYAIDSSLNIHMNYSYLIAGNAFYHSHTKMKLMPIIPSDSMSYISVFDTKYSATSVCFWLEYYSGSCRELEYDRFRKTANKTSMCFVNIPPLAGAGRK